MLRALKDSNLSVEVWWPHQSTLIWGSRDPACSSLGQRHCIVFLSDTLYSYSATLHLGVWMNGMMVPVNLMLGVTLWWICYIHVAFYLGGDYGEIPLVTSCTTELTSISSGLQLANQ